MEVELGVFFSQEIGDDKKAIEIIDGWYSQSWPFKQGNCKAVSSSKKLEAVDHY